MSSMSTNDKTWLINYYIDYIKKITNSRYGTSQPVDNFIDVQLYNNLISAEVGYRPIFKDFINRNTTCIIVLTNKEKILVFFDDDLPKIDSLSLGEIRACLKRLIK